MGSIGIKKGLNLSMKFFVLGNSIVIEITKCIQKSLSGWSFWFIIQHSFSSFFSHNLWCINYAFWEIHWNNKNGPSHRTRTGTGSGLMFVIICSMGIFSVEPSNGWPPILRQFIHRSEWGVVGIVVVDVVVVVVVVVMTSFCLQFIIGLNGLRIIIYTLKGYNVWEDRVTEPPSRLLGNK